MKTTIALGVSAALLSISANATGFLPSHQTKSLAMGGVGVAIPDLTTALTHNPATLSSSKVEGGFWLQLPVATLGASDEDNFIDALDDFQDSEIIDRLDASINSAGTLDSYTDIANNADELSSEIANLSGRQIDASLGLLGSLAVPGQEFGIGIKASTGVSLGGQINYKDAYSLAALSQDLRNFDNCLESNQQTFGSCDPRTMSWNYIDPLSGEVLFNTEDDIASTVSLQGLGVTEIGISLSTSFDVKGKHLAVALTPKLQHVSLINYSAGVETADINDFNEDDFLTNHTEFNTDIAAFFEINEHWNAGLVGTNLLSKEYLTTDQRVVEINPQAVLGLSYHRDWVTVALDVDATKQNLPNGEDEQIVALGVELDALEFARIRIGYRHDLENADRDLVSAGIGFNLLGLNVDIGAAANDSRALASMQLGYRW